MFLSVTVLLLSFLFAQDTKPSPNQDVKPESNSATNQDAKPEQKSAGTCLLVKRMGPADQVTSRFYSFGLRGKQFQYIEGDLPKGIDFHGRLTDHDVRKILDKGGKVRILEQKYSLADLEAMRKSCAGGEGINSPPTEPNMETAQSKERSQTTGTTTTTEHPTEHPSEVPVSASASVASISVSSTPDGAEIYADGEFVGNEPAVLKTFSRKAHHQGHSSGS